MSISAPNLKKLLLVLIVVLAGSLWVSKRPAQAQNTSGSSQPSQTLINYAETSDLNGGLGVNLYFTVLDSVGHVVSTANVKSAALVLDDGSRYETQIQQPNTPFYVVLALDVGGSMTPDAKYLGSALSQALDTAPAGAQFAVVDFEKTVSVPNMASSTGFTSDVNLIKNTAFSLYQKMQSITQGTCLYDAMLQGLDLLSKAPKGRRAMIVFTGGRDELLNSSGPCSQHLIGDVITRATNFDLRTPIYVAVLRDAEKPPDETAMRNLAATTGGTYTATDSSATGVPLLFQDAVSGLKAQWLATAVTYPTAGVHGAALFVSLADGTTLQSTTTRFNAAHAYQNNGGTAGPNGSPVPPALLIDTLNVDTANHQLV